MKNVNGLAKLLALGALTITISITTVSGGENHGINQPWRCGEHSKADFLRV